MPFEELDLNLKLNSLKGSCAPDVEAVRYPVPKNVLLGFPSSVNSFLPVRDTQVPGLTSCYRKKQEINKLHLVTYTPCMYLLHSKI